MSDGGKPVQAFFGFLLLAVGLLMAGLCGLCTGAFIVGGLSSLGRNVGDAGGIVLMALVVGGIPTVMGVGLFIAGRELLRGARPPKRAADVFGDPS